MADTIETYFDSHIDLLQRSLQKHSDRLKLNAEKAFKIRAPSGDVMSKEFLAENFDREVKNFKLKVRYTGCAISAPHLNHLFH